MRRGRLLLKTGPRLFHFPSLSVDSGPGLNPSLAPEVIAPKIMRRIGIEITAATIPNPIPRPFLNADPSDIFPTSLPRRLFCLAGAGFPFPPNLPDDIAEWNRAAGLHFELVFQFLEPKEGLRPGPESTEREGKPVVLIQV